MNASSLLKNRTTGAGTSRGIVSGKDDSRKSGDYAAMSVLKSSLD